MTVRRDTKRWLKEDPGVFDQVLARICGAWDEEDPPDRPPHPWQVCRNMGLSYGALLAWISDDDAREEKFARALRIRAQLLADQMIQIADTPQLGIETKTKADGGVETTEGDMLGHRKLQIQARQWIASKLDRKRYGEHVTHEVEATLLITDAATELEMLERKLGLRAPVTIEHEPAAALPAPDTVTVPDNPVPVDRSQYPEVL